MTFPIPVHTGTRAKRFVTLDGTDPIPDMLHLEDGRFVVNPEWEAAIYEEVFMRDGEVLEDVKTMCDLARHLHDHPNFRSKKRLREKNLRKGRKSNPKSAFHKHR